MPCRQPIDGARRRLTPSAHRPLRALVRMAAGRRGRAAVAVGAEGAERGRDGDPGQNEETDEKEDHGRKLTVAVIPPRVAGLPYGVHFLPPFAADRISPEFRGGPDGPSRTQNGTRKRNKKE